MNIPDLESINNPAKCQERYFKIHFPEFHLFINENFKDCEKFTEKLYWYYHDINEFPRCPICGKEITHFRSFLFGYSKFCSQDCSSKSTAVKNRRKETCLERFGYISNLQDPEQKERIKQTNIERYGVVNPFLSDEIKERIKQTNIERYGVASPSISDEIKERIKQTNIERYGVDNFMKISAKKKMMEKFPFIIDSIDEDYICECINTECSKCTNKVFKINRYLFRDRIKQGNELCTVANPVNSGFSSNIELFIHEILRKHKVLFRQNVRDILPHRELDIYIPTRKIAVECNGVYWHSRHDKTYHYDKWRMCKERGIHLITIWEDQIINKPEIVEGLMNSYLDIYDKRVYARDCMVGEVVSCESLKFLEENHLQGKVNGSIKFGLYHNDELLSIMVFGKKRKALGAKDMENEYELYRYCNKLGTQVIGGASRLFNHFLGEHPGCTVESFSSNDISMGDLYRTLGFQYAGEQKGSYWYIDKKLIRHHSYDYRKNVLVEKYNADPTLTEFQITDDMGLFRIYDSGQQKWIYKN